MIDFIQEMHEEMAKRPCTWKPSPKDISDALTASFNWDMAKISMHNLRTLRVAAGLWLEHLTNTQTE
jgi:hypothetical protein